MPFQPNVNDELQIGRQSFMVEAHPLSADVPYGQEGRQGTVYRLRSAHDQSAWALKVFRPTFRLPALVYQAEQLATFAELPALQVCQRQVMTPQHHFAVISRYPELLYAVLMPWIDGPTWMDVLLDKRQLSRTTALRLSEALALALSVMEQRGIAHGDLSAANVILPGLNDEGKLTGDENSLIVFVDVEQMCGPGLHKPEMMPAGSPGYARMTGMTSDWNVLMDRYAGGIMLAEMMAWCDKRVREAAWGESYFDPGRMTEDKERTDLLLEALSTNYGEAAAFLFQRACSSLENGQCPTFGEWAVMLKSLLLQQEGVVDDGSNGHPAVKRTMEGPTSGLLEVRFGASHNDDKNRATPVQLPLSEQAAGLPNEAANTNRSPVMQDENEDKDETATRHDHVDESQQVQHAEQSLESIPEPIVEQLLKQDSHMSTCTEPIGSIHTDSTTNHIANNIVMTAELRERLSQAQQAEQAGRWEDAIHRYEQLLGQLPSAADIGSEVAIALKDAKQSWQQAQEQERLRLIQAAAKRKRIRQMAAFVSAVVFIAGSGVLFWTPWKTQETVVHVAKPSDPAVYTPVNKPITTLKNEPSIKPKGEKPVQPTKPPAQPAQKKAPASSKDKQKSRTEQTTSNQTTQSSNKASKSKSAVNEKKARQDAAPKPAPQPEPIPKPVSKPESKPIPKPVPKPNQAETATQKQKEKQQQIKSLEDSILHAFNVEDDTDKVIRLAKQLKKIDPKNKTATKMLKDLVGG